MTATTTESPAEALARIQGTTPNSNDAIVMICFHEQGIPLDDIDPRVNVLTYRAWLAKGRHVRKGERGVHLTTWIPIADKLDADGKVIKAGGVIPKSAYVFHVSQTEPNNR